MSHKIDNHNNIAVNLIQEVFNISAITTQLYQFYFFNCLCFSQASFLNLTQTFRILISFFLTQSSSFLLTLNKYKRPGTPPKLSFVNVGDIFLFEGKCMNALFLHYYNRIIFKFSSQLLPIAGSIEHSWISFCLNLSPQQDESWFSSLFLLLSNQVNCAVFQVCLVLIINNILQQ